MANYKLNVAMSTHTGIQRDHNEDAVAYYYPEDYEILCQYGAMFVLADGVGGLPDGEKASHYTVDRLIELYYQMPTDIPTDQALRQCIQQINVEVYRDFETNLATTLVATVVRDETVTIAHVGDSRLYWYNGNEVKQHTKDHVARVVENGKLGKKKLARAVGYMPHLEVDVQTGTFESGNAFLMLTDGATAYLNEDDLRTLMIEDPRQIAADIIRYSIQGGGHDNISAVIVFIEDTLVEEKDLKKHLRHLNRQGVSVHLADEARREPPSLSFGAHWRLFLATTLILVSAILSLLIYIQQLNRDQFIDLTQVPAGATLGAPLATTLDDRVNIETGQIVIFEDNSVAYIDTNESIVAFTIIPETPYQVLGTHLDDDNQVWYELSEGEEDQSGWINETNLPTYAIVD